MTAPYAGSTDPLEGRAAVGGGGFGGIGSPKALIGRGLDDADTQRVLDRCLELGITLIDTAHSYAAGESQRSIGRWLATDAERRPRVAIVDKLGILDRSGELGVDLSPAAVLAGAEEGRVRMGVESVDVVMTHAPDEATPVADTLGAFADLIAQGRARFWGLSNVTAADLESWLAAADRLGAGDPLLVENEFSLLARGDEDGVLPLCRSRGIGYLAFSPLAGGVLTGKYQRGQPPPDDSRLALRDDSSVALSDGVHDAVDSLARRAEALGVSTAGLALAWVLAQPGIRPIVGPRRPVHMDAVVEALQLELTGVEADAIGAIFDSPEE